MLYLMLFNVILTLILFIKEFYYSKKYSNEIENIEKKDLYKDYRDPVTGLLKYKKNGSI